MLIRISDDDQSAVTYWIDTFHTPSMQSNGTVAPDGTIDVFGT